MLVVGISAASVGGFFLIRSGVDAQDRKLLQADAAQASQLLGASFGSLTTSLTSLGTVATLAGGQGTAFQHAAGSLAGHGSSVGFVRQSGDGFTVVTGAGSAFTSGQPVSGALATDLRSVTGQLHAYLVSKVKSTDTLAFAIGAPLTPPGTAVVEQVTFDSAVSRNVSNSGPFKGLDFALYASSAPLSSKLVLSTTAHVPLAGETAQTTSAVGADKWLLVVSAKAPLAGSLAAGAPWILLGSGLLVALLAGSIVESIGRRERFAADLVARRTTELEQRTKEVTVISDVADLLQSCQTIEEAGRVVSELAGGLFPGTTGAMYVYAASRNELDVIASWGAEPVPFFAPDECWALRRGRTQAAAADGPGPRCAHTGPDAGEYLCVPMLAQGEIVGLFHVATTTSDGASGLAGVAQSASTVSEHLALAIASLQLRDTLRNQSIRDPLTGLFNRRYMEESLERELHRASRHGTPVSILMIDVDHFKDFNDSFGHDAGDRALARVAESFLTELRGEDIACRYGGEEFLLVLPGASPEDAENLGQAICVGVRALRVTSTPGPSLTVSIGVASYPGDGADAKDLVRRADLALYNAKGTGRDRVVSKLADAVPAASPLP
ncbi:MAG: GGDEF domain-containing protein [Acidimicrobiales bacterium]